MDCGTHWQGYRKRFFVGYTPGPSRKTFFGRDTACEWWTADNAEAYIAAQYQQKMLTAAQLEVLIHSERRDLDQFLVFHLHLRKETKDINLGTANQYSSSVGPIVETDFAGVYRLMKLEGTNVFLEADGVRYLPAQITPQLPQWDTYSQVTTVPLFGGAVGIGTVTCSWSNLVTLKFPRFTQSGEPIVAESTKQVRVILISIGGKQHVFTFDIAEGGEPSAAEHGLTPPPEVSGAF